MTSRRRVLRACSVGGLGLLAGCSAFGGDDGGGSQYHTDVPAPSAFPDHSMTRVAHFDLAEIRNHPDVTHPECRSQASACTTFHRDYFAQGVYDLDLEALEAVTVGGAASINSYPRSIASTVGMHLFKIYNYSADSAAMRSALEDHFAPASSWNGFQFYRNSGDSAGSVAADDGSTLVVGLDGAARIVVERLAGEHDSYASVDRNRRLVRERLGSNAIELVRTREGNRADDAAWHERSLAIGRSVAFTGSTVTYRTVHRFQSASTPSSVSDDQVRSWAGERLQPFAVEDGATMEDLSIERDGQTLTVSVSAPQYVGIF